MTPREIQENLAHLAININKEEFIYDFLLAFGFSRTTITRLKKGDFNKAKNPDEVLHAGKIFFKTSQEGTMLHQAESLAQDEKIQKHKPRFIILTDFQTIVARDTKLSTNQEFPITDLAKYYQFFLPLTGAEIYKSANDNKADRDASYQLAKLYDILVEDNAQSLKGHSHQLNLFLSRLLFCFFAEDTGIFEKEGIFTDTLANHTAESGADVHLFLAQLFQKLNTKEGDFPAYLQDFPYVNGGLFGQEIPCPIFSKKARNILLECGNLNWDEVNPDIFGSMIQAVADPEERSSLGMHYTSVPNILKLIRPLFLDSLYAEFQKNENNAKALQKLLVRMGKIKFFDPACGSGNFLIITYKELRLLEIQIIKRLIELNPNGQTSLYFTEIHLSQFYGIEIKSFAHEMAMLSLWLSEHQMNKIFETELQDFGQSYPILPLKESGKIVCTNAATTQWETVCPPSTEDEIYIIRNPPYLGSRNQDAQQKQDMELVFQKDYKSMDYVSIWFYKGAKYIQGYNASLAFVSTNSICQGLLVELTWKRILNENIEIHFAHPSFKWANNAKGNAGVTVIIVGLRNTSTQPKYLYQNEAKKEAKNINAYLLDSDNIMVSGKSKPISDFPEMLFGNMPNDGGYLLFDEQEYKTFLEKFPLAQKYIKKYMGGSDFLNGKNRYALWLNDENLKEALLIPEIEQRLEKVRLQRSKSTEKSTRAKAETPHLFYFSGHKDTDSFIIPRTSSENRDYIPIGFLTSDTVIADSAMAVYDAEPWLFGVLHSKMHMVWVDAVGGKLETRYRYSAKLCYNTFPFPKIDARQKLLIKEYVWDILAARGQYPHKTMAWLYNPETMPQNLRAAHQALDLCIDKIYRPHRPFASDTERLELLFKMYQQMTNP